MIQDPIIDTSTWTRDLYLVSQKILKASSQVSRCKDYQGSGKGNKLDHSNRVTESEDEEPKLTKISKTLVCHLRHFKSFQYTVMSMVIFQGKVSQNLNRSVIVLFA